MRTPLRINASWIVPAATAALCLAFWLPFGQERLNRTTYSSFGKLVANFAPARTSPSTVGAVPSTPDSSATQGPGGRSILTAQISSGVPGSAASSATVQRRKTGRRHPSRKNGPARPSAPAPPESPDKRPDAPSPIEGIPLPAPPLQAAARSLEDYTPDLIRDSFDGELSKFPLNAKTGNERVLLRLDGLCRWSGHYILKVSVDNQTGGDFFVKELSAYDGSAYVTLKSYFRLLVEPGRTREGHVLFDAPAGAKIKITLKEDRENGRVLEVPVRYPF